MPYKHYDLPVTSIDDAFSKMCTAMVNMGWTLHDSVSTTEKVYKSNGSNSDRPYGYIRLYSSSGRIYFEPYLYWNETTHAGTCVTYVNSNYVAFAAGSRLWVAGDDDLVMFRESTTTGTYKFFGHIPTFFNSTHTTLTAGATSGASATLTVDSTTGFASGKKFQIVGLTEGRDQLEVESVTDTTHLVVANLPRNYASGAHLGFPAHCFGGNTHNTYPENFYCVAMPDAVGLTAPGSSPYLKIDDLLPVSTMDPGAFSGRWVLGPSLVMDMSQTYLIGMIDNNFLRPGGGSIDDIFGLNDDGAEPESGSPTSVSTTTIADSSKSWGTNEHQNRYVVIVDGTGVKQIRKILSNTATELTVNTWFTTPDMTSDFKICDKAYRLNTSDGDALMVGLEQEYTIS